MSDTILAQTTTQYNTPIYDPEPLETMYYQELAGEPNFVRFVYDDILGWRDLWNETPTDESYVHYLLNLGEIFAEPVRYFETDCTCTPDGYTCQVCRNYARSHFGE